MLKKDQERSFWDAIDYHFMTEESEGEDDTVVRHMLPWRSDCKLASLFMNLFRRLVIAIRIVKQCQYIAGRKKYYSEH